MEKVRRNVNCRVGSLEICRSRGLIGPTVNCRVGSLENAYTGFRRLLIVNCRVGSLEYIDIVQNKCWIFLP